MSKNLWGYYEKSDELVLAENYLKNKKKQNILYFKIFYSFR